MECFLAFDDAVQDSYIPKLLIQPLVENAIIQGLGMEPGLLALLPERPTEAFWTLQWLCPQKHLRGAVSCFLGEDACAFKITSRLGQGPQIHIMLPLLQQPLYPTQGHCFVETATQHLVNMV